MIPILVLNGPNLNLLGEREPGIYGRMTLDEINQQLVDLGKNLGLKPRFEQSNHEGVLIDAIQDAQQWAKGIIFNPGGYTHTSVALHDAIAAIQVPVIEVHLSNPQGREDFRHISFITPVAAGTIAGFGWRSYTLAMYALDFLVKDLRENTS